jgi:O-antigen/teichoic acid export membrane protein
MKASPNGGALALTRLRAALSGRSQSISAQILRGASSSAVLKVVYTGLTFVTAILLARFLGVDEYGTYVYAMSWVLLLGVFAGLGLNQVLVANVAVYHQKDDWAHISGILRFAIAAVTAASILCALAVVGTGWLLHRDEPSLYIALLLACLLLPLRALLLPIGATQNGLRQVTYAQIPTLLLTPACFLMVLALSFGLEFSPRTAPAAIILQAIATSVGVVVAVLLLRKGLAAAGRPSRFPPPHYEPKTWFLSGVPLILMGSMFLVNSNADILMLGGLAGPTEAGIYKAAARGAELLAFGLSIIGAPLGPIVARLYAADDRTRLQRELVRWGRIAFVPTLILAAILVLGGKWFLSLFGADFVTDEASSALSILALGQLVRAGAGPVEQLLIMTGNGRAAAWLLAVAAAVNVALNAALIPAWGVGGAAVATASSTALFTLLLVGYSVRKLQINTTVIPFPALLHR